MPHSRGGSVRLIKIIEDVHRLVNEHRISIGLKQIQFEDTIGDDMSLTNGHEVVNVGRSEDWPLPPEKKIETELYSADEINLALSSNGSIRVHVKAGDPKIKCACNCGQYLPATSAMQGWKYIYKHKNPDALTKGGRLKNGSSEAKPVVKGEVYVSFISRIKMDKANVEYEMKQIQEEANRLMTKLKGLKEEFTRLETVEKALLLLTPEKSISVGA